VFGTFCHFHPSLIFSSKAGAYPSEETFRYSRVGITLGWKGPPGTNSLAYLAHFANYSCKKFYNIDLWNALLIFLAIDIINKIDK